MADLIEVRWHGRGGQGAKTASQLLAGAALDEDMYIQAFSEYGPERMGAPIQSFTRISKEPIMIHCHVTDPEVVVVLDPTLLGTVDVASGLSEEGKLIVNTNKSPSDIRKETGLKGARIYTVDATQIALDCLGRPIPNTPMIGALIKVTELIKIENL
ncbi:MAG: 2-oxoacid:acceptor oxidoreductase family protein, partial [Candidatus Aminicenantes bacterium]|nr:2-oxoacid:acceptor oxidoreductase family protein [Candidatus Aminicenantes bacterium]